MNKWLLSAMLAGSPLLLVVTSVGCDSTSSDDGASGGGRDSGENSASGGRGDGSAGGDGSFGGGSALPSSCTVFPKENPWNQDVSKLPVAENSDAYIDSIGRDAHLHPDFGTVWDGSPIGIPYVLVGKDEPRVNVDFVAYGDESDPGPYPIPLTAPVEGQPKTNGDRHVIAVDMDNCRLYELYRGFAQGDSWQADSGATFDLKTNDTHPQGCTSADAAGLPIFPGLVRYDEVVEKKLIAHALRFTVARTQKAYLAPAGHYASDDTDPALPPMGLRLRMKASFDCASFSEEAQVICAALKTYGMLVADNGSNWYISGAPDSRWNDEHLGDLKTVSGDAFEVVDTGAVLVTDAPDCAL